MAQRTLLLSALAAILAIATQVVHVNADHTFTLMNRCPDTVNPTVANVNCSPYSDRCDEPGSGGVPNPAIPFTGDQPRPLHPGESDTIIINRQWNGRIFNQDFQSCAGATGENCTVLEFNLDTGASDNSAHGSAPAPTPQEYNISNAEGFTQSIQIAVNGCDTVTCTNVDCGCANAYPPGGSSQCGNESPVRGCSAGDKSWTITFCPEA